MTLSKRFARSRESKERIVVDTGVLVSAAFGGTPLEALERARRGRVIVSRAIAAEVAVVIDRLGTKIGPGASWGGHRDPALLE